MNTREHKPKIRWWEYPWYVVVSVFLLSVGLVVWILRIPLGVLRMRGKGRLILGGLVVLVLFGIGGALWFYHQGTDLGDRVVTVDVNYGDGFSGVADKLADEGVVRSKLALKIGARLRGLDKRLIPGRYNFTGINSASSVLDKLAQGNFLRIKVTVPEGSAIWDVAAIVAKKLDLDSATFVALNEDSIFLAEIGKPYLEGYLFPETYHFQWGISERDVAKIMVGQFERLTAGVWPDEIILGLTKREIVILASIIEAETSVEDEREMVASVYTNRLRKNWRLDADPTVIYGLGGLERPLYRKDLRIDTPYNTYLRKGLPPTPINSPGLASIKAALKPAESDYFFFVADNTGGHYFSRTNAEHERAIGRIRSGNN